MTVVGKVIELLGLLRRQLEEDGRADRQQYNQYAAWYTKEKASVDRVLGEASQKIEALQTSIAQEEAFHQRTYQSLERAAAEQASAERERADVIERRDREHRTFVPTEAELSKASDQFERALEVLAKKASGSAAAAAFLDGGSAAGTALGPYPASGAGLLEVARKLRDTLERGGDFALSQSQRESLDDLFRIAAARSSSTGGNRAPGFDGGAEPSFLQVKAAQGSSMPYGQYEGQSSGLIGTLQSVLDKTQAQLEDVRKQEVQAAEVFKKLKEQMEADIKSKEAGLADLKMQLSRSEEKVGQQKAQLLAAKQLLKVTQDQLHNSASEYGVKTVSFKERSQKRDDEKLAVVEALKILQSEVASKLFGDHFSDPSASSFLQVSQASQRGSIEILRQAATPRISLLALRMQTRRASGRRAIDSADPFGEVKSMISSMLRKLEDSQNQDMTHASWCDSELAKSAKSKEAREADVRKIRDRLEEMDAEIAQLGDDLKTVSKDVADMQQASSKAAALRQAEGSKAISSLAEYRDAQKLIKSAMEVLTRFYAKQEEETPDPSGYRANSGAGSSVIGILEVALADYAQLEEELTLSEKGAAKDFNDLMSETQVRMAVFSKDSDYKSRTKVKLEGDRMRASTDLTSYQKELDALSSYLDQLKASCVVKGDSYDERKGRREKELKSLHEALAFLNGEGLA